MLARQHWFVIGYVEHMIKSTVMTLVKGYQTVNIASLEDSTLMISAALVNLPLLNVKVCQP